MKPTFSLKIVTVDFYISPPTSGLDVTYSEFRGSSVSYIPVIRIFGSTDTGKKACLHVHGVFPYMYVPYDSSYSEDINIHQLASIIDKSVNVSLGQASSTVQHIYKISVVSGVPFYGFHRKQHQFLKLHVYNPLILKKISDLLENEAILGKFYQPHESHIPFILQFMIDYNLHGMSYINLSEVKLRQKLESHSEGLEKNSYCEIECDAYPENILNRLQVFESNDALNPGIAALWEDEKQRQRNENQNSEIEFCLTLETRNINPTKSHFLYKQALHERLSILADESETEKTLSASVYPAQILESSDIMKASHLEISFLENSVNHQEDKSNVSLTKKDLDTDSQFLLNVLQELGDNMTVEEGSLLSQNVETEDGGDEGEDCNEDLDLSISIDTILTPKEITEDSEEHANNADVCGNTVKLQENKSNVSLISKELDTQSQCLFNISQGLANHMTVEEGPLYQNVSTEDEGKDENRDLYSSIAINTIPTPEKITAVSEKHVDGVEVCDIERIHQLDGQYDETDDPSHSSRNMELARDCVDGKNLVPVLRRYDLLMLRAMITHMNRIKSYNKTKDFSDINEYKEVHHSKFDENNFLKECECSKKCKRNKRMNKFVENFKNNYNLISRKKYNLLCGNNIVCEETTQMNEFGVKQNETALNKDSQNTNMIVLDMPILDGSSEITYKPYVFQPLNLNFAPEGLSEEFCDILKLIKQIKDYEPLDLNSKPNNASRYLNKRSNWKINFKHLDREHINGAPHFETSSSKCEALNLLHKGGKPKFHLKPGKRPYVLSGDESIVKVRRFNPSRIKFILGHDSLQETVTLRSPIKAYNLDIPSRRYKVELDQEQFCSLFSSKTESSCRIISVQYKLNLQNYSFDIKLDNSNCSKYSLVNSSSLMTEMFPVQYFHENEELANSLLAQVDEILFHGNVCQLKILQKYKEEIGLISSTECENLKGFTFTEIINCQKNCTSLLSHKEFINLDKVKLNYDVPQNESLSAKLLDGMIDSSSDDESQEWVRSKEEQERPTSYFSSLYALGTKKVISSSGCLSCPVYYKGSETDK